MANVENRTMSIGQLLRDVRGGNLRVPRFQGEFVWRNGQVLSLFKSIQQRYPIGSLLIWRTTERYRSFDFVGPLSLPENQPPEPTPIGYVLDGHQRMTALYGVLALDEDRAVRLHGSQRVFLVYFDLDKECFMHAGSPEPHHLPVRHLLGEHDALSLWIDERRDQTAAGTPDRLLWDQRRRRALTLQTTFAQYTIPYLDVTGASVKEAVEVFVLLNTEGTHAGRREVMNALTWRDGAFDFMASAREALKDAPAYGNFGVEPILRALLASLGEDIYADIDLEVLRRHEGKLPQAMQEVRDAFLPATSFLANEVGAMSGRVVPYALQLVLLVEFYRICPRPGRPEVDELIRWFWASSFSGAYSLGGGLSYGVAIDRARRLANGERAVILDGVPTLRPFPRNFHGKSARVRAFHLFLKTRAPMDLRTGVVIAPDRLLLDGMADARTVATGGKNGLRLSSRLLLGPGRKRPLEDLRALSERANCQRILASHLIPREALTALLDGDEEVFLDRREQLLVEAEREFARSYVAIPSAPVERVEEEGEIDVEETGEVDID